MASRQGIPGPHLDGARGPTGSRRVSTAKGTAARAAHRSGAHVTNRATNKDPWYVGWDITDAERARFRKISNASREAKRAALESPVALGLHLIYEPRLNPPDLMPQAPSNGLVALSLFS